LLIYAGDFAHKNSASLSLSHYMQTNPVNQFARLYTKARRLVPFKGQRHMT